MTAADPDLVRSQMEKILVSPGFLRSERMKSFLRFIVETELDGQRDQLKEICIGYAVFGCEASYDPKIDPIVRVEARRLRSKLQKYYEERGARDHVLIHLPKGRYRPQFESRAEPDAPSTEFLVDTQPIDAECSAAVAAEATSVHTEIAPTSVPLRIRLPAFLVVPVLSIALLLGVFAVFLPRIAVRWQRLAVMASVRPLMAFPSQKFQASLSPDGRQVAFVGDGNGGNYDIYVKLLDGDGFTRLTHDAAHDLHPAWSPDGRDIALLRVSPDKAEVVMIPSRGGPERILGALHSTTSVWRADATQMIGPRLVPG